MASSRGGRCRWRPRRSEGDMNGSTRRDLRRGPVILASSVAVSSVLTGLVGLAIPRLLGPTHFGQFQLAQSIWQFGLFANLGVPWAGQRVIGRAGNPTDGAGERRAVDTALTFLLAVSARSFPIWGAPAAFGPLAIAVRIDDAGCWSAGHAASVMLVWRSCFLAIPISWERR